MTLFDLSGSTLEACNCDAICPCRKVDGVPGGRSTHGECTGILTWRIDRGTIDELDVSGLAVVMAIWYSDDEPGSPWRWALYLDDRAGPATQAALADLWAGRLGGSPLRQFPWARNPSNLVATLPARIELDHTPGSGWLRIGERLELRVAGHYATESTVTCVIPGHDQSGRELVAATLVAEDEHFSFAFAGTCGYEATFHYTST